MDYYKGAILQNLPKAKETTYMFKIPKSASLSLSLAISALFFIVCIAGIFILPSLTEMLINLPDNIGNRDSISEIGRMLVLFVAYCIVITFISADVLLFAILVRVKGGKVFTQVTVALIRGVSWCCFLLCLFFGVLGIYFQLSFFVAFLAVFLGLCLRVVKNVIEEATEIKNENDLTV